MIPLAEIFAHLHNNTTTADNFSSFSFFVNLT